MIVGLATRGEDGKPMREKIDAVSFGWFYPFFFVGTGVKFDITALGKDLTTMLLIPTFVILLLVIRGASALLYRNEITRMERFSFALCSAVPSLSIIIVITEIGLKSKSMSPDIAAALVAAGLLCILLFPTIAGALLARTTVPAASAPVGAARGSRRCFIEMQHSGAGLSRMLHDPRKGRSMSDHRARNSIAVLDAVQSAQGFTHDFFAKVPGCISPVS